MDVAPERVRSLLGGPDLAWLVDRAVTRWSRGQPLGETLRLATASPAQHEAVAALMGRRARSGGALSVRVADVEAVLLSAGAAPDLRSAVVALRGVVPDVAGARAAEADAWAEAHRPLEALVAGQPSLGCWVDRVRATGLLRRLATSPSEAATLADRAARVVATLPLDRAELRGHLANRVLGDAHALDDGRQVTTLVLGAAAALAAGSLGTESETDGSAGSRRRVWAAVGVAVGGVAAPVLTLGLPGDAASSTGRVLELCREAGQPIHLTLRQLIGSPPDVPLSGRDVFVCENPSVVEHAADRCLDGAAAPLVCTHGQPSAAVAALLDCVVAAGARLHHHGDFDWGGLRIAERVMRTWGARPWRMAAADYDAAVDGGVGGRALRGAPAESPWDPLLAQRMAETGVVVEEEAVVDGLLADLESG